MAKRKTHEEFIKEVKEKQPNIKILSEYKNSRSIIKYKCLICGHEDKKRADHLSERGCHICSGYKKTTKQFIEELNKINPNIEVLGEYKGAREPILVKCKIDGHEWSPMATSLVNKDNRGIYNGCPKCGAKSISEHMKVRMKGLFVRENNPNWNPNLTDEERNKKRDTQEHINWRKEVFKRDDYTCQCCGSTKGGILNAHHLDSYSSHKEKRLDIDNGITLCENCHKDFHKKYGYGENTKEQFEEWLDNLKNNN